jgi:acetylglutamate kinase
LKLGGELLETAEGRDRISDACVATLATRPLVIVHGGGRAIDAELDRRGIAPSKIDGLRITDAATLDAVVSVLAGSANTELVAALVAKGVAAVGLTGVDAGLGRAARSASHPSASGAVVDLGLVGDPAEVDPALIELLLVHGYVPVIASLGIEEGAGARVLNVNADVMAGRIAAALGGADLVIAGATAGVLDAAGRRMDALDADGIASMIASGTATAGMIAKLNACRAALLDGANAVRIVDGRGLGSVYGIDDAPGTSMAISIGTLR